MKNKRFLFLLLLFFLLNFSFGLASFSYEKVFANTETNQNKYSFSVVCDGKKFKFFDTDFETNKTMSIFQKNTRNENINETTNKLLKMGFSKEEAKNNCIKQFFGEDNHSEKELKQYNYEISVTSFNENHMSEGI